MIPLHEYVQQHLLEGYKEGREGLLHSHRHSYFNLRHFFQIVL